MRSTNVPDYNYAKRKPTVATIEKTILLMEKHRIARVGLILLVLVASVGISASALLGFHQHESSARTCDLCLVGHMPWTGPTTLALTTAPVVVEWRQIAERPASASEADLNSTSSRAPPAL